MNKFFKLARYILGGGIATLSNLVILFLLVNYLNFWYLAAAIIAFCAGVIISYLLQKYFVFRNFSRENVPEQFSYFFVFALFMLGTNTLLMYIFVDIIGLWYLSAQVLAASLIAFANYTYFNKFLFINAD